MKQWLLILFMFGLCLPTTKVARAGEIRITDPWIREAPAVAQVLAAFMTISNDSRQSVQLEAASSTDFSTVEIHRSMTHAGMAHMMKQSSLEIEGGGSVALRPGGYHLMLMKPKRSLPAGTEVTLQLSFDNGETIDVTAVVRKQ